MDKLSIKMSSSAQKVDNRFNCPIDGCVYGQNGDKYFKKKMLLSQHIANVHSEKKYCCDRCNKKYAIEWQLKYHLKSCGVEWSCDSCGKSYIERLSLVTHCKRHSHQLPQNAYIRTSKTNSPQINVQLIVMPVILDSNSISNQTLNQFNSSLTQLTPKPIHILPKVVKIDDKTTPQTNISTQTSIVQECDKCKTKTSLDSNESVSLESTHKKNESVSTQTDRYSQKSGKSRESRSTECQTITKRNRRPAFHCESTETQTLESALHSNGSSSHYDCVKISASTSTTPPKKTRKRCSIANENNVRSVKKLCAFTQTVKRLCDSETSTDEFELLMNSVNPLLSQMNSTSTVILEQSVQTETDSTSDLSFELNNIETQTVNIDINPSNLLNFSADNEFLFSDLEFTDIETQTIWNNDRTTQTDDHLDEIDDVIKKYLDNDNSCEAPNQTYFADTETQTQIDFPLLICSYAQT